MSTSRKDCEREGQDFLLDDNNFQEGEPLSLFDYFIESKPGVVKSWIKLYKKDRLESFAELLSFILQVAGHRTNITAESVESHGWDVALADFQVHLSDLKPPYKTLSKIIPTFWIDFISALMSAEAPLSAEFSHLIEWLCEFANCKSRAVRKCTLPCIASIYVSLSKTNYKGPELQTVYDHALFIYRKCLTIRIQDVDYPLCVLAISSITQAAINSPNSVFTSESQLNDISIVINSSDAKCRREAIKCFILLLKSKTGNEDLLSLLSQTVLTLVQDIDPKVVSLSLDALSILESQGKIDKSQLSKSLTLLADSSPLIRESASKLVRQVIPQDVTSLLEFSKSFGPMERQQIIESLRPVLSVDEIVQKMFTSQPEDGFILSAMLKSLQITISPKTLTQLIEAFWQYDQTVINILSCVKKLDFKHCEDLCDLNNSLIKLFNQSKSIAVCNETVHCMYLMSPFGFQHTLDELVDRSPIEKLSSVGRYADISRRMDEALESDEVECVRYCFQWKAVNKSDDQPPIDFFYSHIDEKEGYIGMATVIILTSFVTFDMQMEFVRRCGKFNMEGICEVTNHIDPLLLVFPLCYVKPFPNVVKEIWQKVTYKPISGKWVVEALRVAALGEEEKMAAGKWFAGKVQADEVIEAWREEELEEEVPFLEYIFATLTPESATHYSQLVKNEKVKKALDAAGGGRISRWRIGRPEPLGRLQLIQA